MCNNIYQIDWVKTGRLPKVKKYKFLYLIGIIFLIFLGIFYINIYSKKEFKNSQKEIEKKEENEKNISESKKNNFSNGYLENIRGSNEYKKYIDKEYGFYLIIPNEYNIDDTIDSGNRLLLSNDDKSVLIFIGASENKFDLKIPELMNQYISILGEKVDYKAFGDEWYVISKNYKGISYYKKTFLKDNKIFWFEFNIKNINSKSKEEKKKIQKLIELMEDNFNILY